MGDHYRQLRVEERVNILLRLRDGMSSRAIARELNRPPSTITREIDRHRRMPACVQLPYEATRAVSRAHMVRFTRRRPRKLADGSELFAHVRANLRKAVLPIKPSTVIRQLHFISVDRICPTRHNKERKFP